MAITGIGRSAHAFPYFVTYYNIDGVNHPTLINVWMGLSSTGNAWGLLLSLVVVYGMGWSWMASLLVYALVYLVLGIGFQLVMDEVEVERQEIDSPSEAFAAVNQHYARQTSNWLLLLEYQFSHNLCLVIIFWLPYYLVLLGYEQNSLLIS